MNKQLQWKQTFCKGTILAFFCKTTPFLWITHNFLWKVIFPFAIQMTQFEKIFLRYILGDQQNSNEHPTFPGWVTYNSGWKPNTSDSLGKQPIRLGNRASGWKNHRLGWKIGKSVKKISIPHNEKKCLVRKHQE